MVLGKGLAGRLCVTGGTLVKVVVGPLLPNLPCLLSS